MGSRVLFLFLGLLLLSAESLAEAGKSDCILSPSHGPCKESLIKYYFDKKEKKCLKFTYGGCKGNTNRFDTEKECQIVCGQKG